MIAGAFLQKCISCGSAGNVRADSMMGTGLISLGLSMLLTLYCIMITYAGVHYHDGLSAIMPSLFPIVLYAFWAMMIKKFTSTLPGTDTEKRLFDVDLQHRVSGISQYYHKDMKELPV